MVDECGGVQVSLSHWWKSGGCPRITITLVDECGGVQVSLPHWWMSGGCPGITITLMDEWGVSRYHYHTGG